MTPYWTNGIATLYHADARDIPLSDKSVHCVVTSPPYWGLRSYGLGEWVGGNSDCEHSQRAPGTPRQTISNSEGYKENGLQPAGAICNWCGAEWQGDGIGLESTINEWLENMVAVGREVWRVLRDDGTFWLNCGDAYAGSGKGMNADGTHSDGDKQNTNQGSVGLPLIRGKRVERGEGSGRWGFGDSAVAGLPAKNLIGMPWRLAFALQDDGWILRKDIIWHKPNPMPESVQDRPTTAHEYIFLFSKAARYFYDAEAIRVPVTGQAHGFKTIKSTPRGDARPRVAGRTFEEEQANGANARSVWTIPTQGYSGAHFATFPEELPRRCILAGTSEKGVCQQCGSPWVRVVEKSGGTIGNEWAKGKTDEVRYSSGTSSYNPNEDVGNGPYKVEILGWEPTCECNAGKCPVHKVDWSNNPERNEYNPSLGYARKKRAGETSKSTNGWEPGCTCNAGIVPATVLDPFAGSGTTLAVAQQLGRHGVGTDLNTEYLTLATKRIGAVNLPLPLGT